MIKLILNKLVVSIFFNNIKIIAVKNSKIIEQVKLKLIFTFFIINISFINFYLDLKI